MRQMRFALDPCGPRRDRRRLGRPRAWLEALEDRRLLDSVPLGNVSLSLRELSILLDGANQIRALQDPALSSQQQAQHAGYLAGDIASEIGNTISLIPGADTKTIGLAFTTGGDLLRLAFFLGTGGVKESPTSEANNRLLRARSDISQGKDTEARQLSDEITTSLMAGTPIAGLNTVSATTDAQLSAMVHDIQTMIAYPLGNPSGNFQKADADFKTQEAALSASLTVTDRGLAEALSDLLALAGDVSNLSGAPPIVGDSLGAAHDVLAFGLDALDAISQNGSNLTLFGNFLKSVQGISDLSALGADVTGLINDRLPAPDAAAQPLSVSITIPASGAGAPQAGVSFSGAVASVSDPNAPANQTPPASNYTAIISWGDGSSSSGQIEPIGDGGADFTVIGDHQYAAAGTYSLGVAVVSQQAQGQQSAEVTVAAGGAASAPRGMTVLGQTITINANGAASGTAATLVAPESGSFAAAIDWGDGTTTAAPLTAAGNNQFDISGSHVYSQPGNYLTRVEVGDTNGNLATVFGAVAAPPPSSAVTALPALVKGNSITLSWSGGDAGGPGIASYNIYYSDDGAPYEAGLTATTLTSDTFTGYLNHIYSFYSIATDADGSVQPAPLNPATTAMVDANGEYVVGVYADVLSRLPDPAGLQYWAQLLDSGTAVGSVAASIAHSPEYYASFVIKPAYQKLLGRAADAAGLAYWIQQMQNGLTDQQLEAGFVSSDEFYAEAGGNNKGWIDAVYKLLLGRAADGSDETYWLGELNSGISRGQAAIWIANSNENDALFVKQDYERYLHRAADAAGLNYWVQQLQQGMTNEDVISGFTGSPEYYQQHTR